MRPLFFCLARPMKDEWKMRPYLGVFPLVFSALHPASACSMLPFPRPEVHPFHNRGVNYCACSHQVPASCLTKPGTAVAGRLRYCGQDRGGEAIG